MRTPKEHQRLMELIGVIRDGGLNETELDELESILQDDPSALQYYVESADLTSMLYRQQGMVDLGDAPHRNSPVTPAGVVSSGNQWSSVACWSAALFVSLIAGFLLGGRMMPSEKLTSAIKGDLFVQANGTDSEIATLSFAADCRWGSADQPRHEGQRLRAETLRLDTGIAVVQFDSDVRLVLEGPCQLELASVDRAMLRYGKTVFTGDGDLDRFTLDTPFSKIQDEGTEYAVSVEQSGKVGEVHVFDGRVTCVRQGKTVPDQLIQLDAGDARRISKTGAIETIQLASNRFVRSPIAQSEPTDALLASESFAYSSAMLAGQNGGTGWTQPWMQELRYDDAPQPKLRRSASLNWPGKRRSLNGGLAISGDSGVSRLLQTPIKMQRNAAYYLSFLVKKGPRLVAADSSGWAYFTMRNAKDRNGKISFGIVTTRGTPRIAHNGRIANSVQPLLENVVYLFVCKILARKDRDDVIQVRIYGDDETVDAVEPSTWNVSTRPIRSDSVLNTFRVSTKNASPIQFDELRFGKTWASVTSPYSQSPSAADLAPFKNLTQ